MLDSQVLVGGAAVVALSVICIVIPRLAPRTYKHPPGPKRWPVVGNILSLPKQGDPLPWIRHKDLYGPISSVEVFGQTVVILNDLKTCIELLDKRSSNYSGRPIFPFAGQMVGWDQQMIMAQPGEHFRLMRKLLKSFIGSAEAMAPFHEIQELETRHFLSRLLEDSSKLVSDIRLTAGAISLRISHGYTIETTKPDPLIKLVQTAAREFYFATMPGAWLVDIFPSLRYLPSWLPGVKFKSIAKVYRQHNLEQTDVPHSFVKRRIEAGDALPSFSTNMMSANPDEKTEAAVKWAATVIYGGGSDPTIAALTTFFLLMTLHPEAQQEARDEIDQVVGTQRLPNFSDRPKLPHVEALIKEVLRWHCTGRLGIPHRAVEDDIYNNYLTPKNSIILPHMWNITRDQTIYSSPSEFRPSRFLSGPGKQPELDPNTYIYGFGRRECPGQDLANSSMFIMVAMTLSVFEIRKPKDENGVEMDPRCQFEGGTVSHPKPFDCIIVPRSKEAEAMIRSVHDEAPRRPSDGDRL